VEEGVKMLPVDALGAVMVSHGEEYGDSSAIGMSHFGLASKLFLFGIGQSLFNLGRAHCRIATLQESFAHAFRDTYLASLEGALEEFTDYASQRKKLDSRRYPRSCCCFLVADMLEYID
jgi:BAR domain